MSEVCFDLCVRSLWWHIKSYRVNRAERAGMRQTQSAGRRDVRSARSTRLWKRFRADQKPRQSSCESTAGWRWQVTATQILGPSEWDEARQRNNAFLCVNYSAAAVPSSHIQGQQHHSKKALFLLNRNDAAFSPFQRSDSRDFQTGSAGRNPKGFRYLNCISPATSSVSPPSLLIFPLAFVLRLFGKWKECVWALCPFLLLFSVQFTGKFSVRVISRGQLSQVEA